MLSKFEIDVFLSFYMNDEINKFHNSNGLHKSNMALIVHLFAPTVGKNQPETFDSTRHLTHFYPPLRFRN